MISRRKTIGTLCDALRTEDKARLKAIRSLLKPSATKQASPAKKVQPAEQTSAPLTLETLRKAAEAMAAKTEGITIKPAKDRDYRHDRKDAIVIESRSDYRDPSGKHVDRKNSYHRLVAFRKALAAKFPGKVGWLPKPYEQGYDGLTKFVTTSWRTVVSILKEPEPPKQNSLKTFARQTVQSASKVSRSKRFGPDLVFISDVGSTPAFKNKLKEAYDRDLIELVKADMPQALPPEKLQKSKIKTRTVDLVFIRVPS